MDTFSWINPGLTWSLVQSMVTDEEWMQMTCQGELKDILLHDPSFTVLSAIEITYRNIHILMKE
jgi:hypothetical protein